MTNLILQNPKIAISYVDDHKKSKFHHGENTIFHMKTGANFMFCLFAEYCLPGYDKAILKKEA